MVRDGRLQAPKKRTDRSYLRPTPAVEDEPLPEDVAPETVDEAALPESAGPAAPEAASDPTAAFAPPKAAPAPASPTPRDAIGARASSAAPATAASSGKLPTSIRAIQQQGVRKRRDVDLQALAVRDTNYAIHEIRRIAILTAMVIISLVVLTIVLR
jgi:hypothetical protein